jgi:hypothetical protein
MMYDSETFEAHRHAAERAEMAWREYENAQAEADALKVDAISAARAYAEMTSSIGRAVRSTRNTRMSPAVLTEVAEVYRAALIVGEPPTEAVAKHFNKSHSTAARWVMSARHGGHLGPALGPTGGELSA